MNRPNRMQFDQICRLCLNLSDLVNIFERHPKTQKESLGLLVRETVEMLGLAIEPEDGLPKKICVNCKDFLRQLYKFRNQCQEANDLLVEALTSSSAEQKQQLAQEPLLVSHTQSVLKNECLEDVEIEPNFEAAPQSVPIHPPVEESIAEIDSCSNFSDQVCVKIESPNSQQLSQIVEHVEHYEFLDAEEESVQDETTYDHVDLRETEIESEYVIETYDDIASDEQNSVFREDGEYTECKPEHDKVNERQQVFEQLDISAMKSNKGQLCKMCGKFSTCLKYHMMCHTGERPFACNQCEKSFRTATKLRIHVNCVHLKVRKYTCDVCNRKFLDSGNLRNHKVIHSGERKYVCNYEGCNKTFALPGTLTVHKKSHTQDKQFACDYCSKLFLYKWLLVKHLRTHTGEKPYQCDVCQKKFSTTTHMHTHKKKIHDRTQEKSPRKLVAFKRELHTEPNDLCESELIIGAEN
ncbi:zinc finger protein 28 homolog [Topomyia yanbarensis]|uniref:zinc finger protein 28 homolog n=1 Tax=Topomyia yanbarensis TaxID=2498891 RepID=UPI00273BC749|nr:zinc finger protein 28 homolog [Topomyia yanbarensis]